MDLVTDYARGEYGDITISNEDARGVMGRIGLGGEKPLRKVGELSGGEKARVALSMFALKASNLLLLDEVSVVVVICRCSLPVEANQLFHSSFDSPQIIWTLNGKSFVYCSKLIIILISTNPLQIALKHLVIPCRLGVVKMGQ